MTEVDEQQDRRQDLLWKVFIWAIAGMNGLLLWQVQRNTDRVDNALQRITIVESSRCTAMDCSSLRESVAIMRANISTIPREIPPAWFLERVKKIERRFEILENEVHNRKVGTPRGQWKYSGSE